MTIKQQGGIFGRNPTFNDVDATDITSSTITATASVSTPVETISGNTSSVAFSSNSAGMLFSGGTDATKYSGIVFRGANSWNTFLGRIPDGAADPLVIGNDAISAFGAMCTFGYSDVTINRGNLVIGTSGQGIDFSATSGTGTSELFSDYEEGVFTPSIIGSASAGTGTYAYQIGRYTKIGDRVLFNLIMSWSAHTGTGFMRIDGLPFTSMASSPYYHAVNIGYIDNITTTAGTVPSGFIPNNSTQIWMGQIPTGGGAWSYMGIDTAGDINISGQYEV